MEEVVGCQNIQRHNLLPTVVELHEWRNEVNEEVEAKKDWSVKGWEMAMVKS